MRVVREKMEAKISELPYNLPSDLYDYLAQDVVQHWEINYRKIIGIYRSLSDKFR